MPVTSHPNESAAYRTQRAELLEAEIALKDAVERVAALRRGLPLDTVVVAGDVGAFREYARGRGWRNVRVLSSGGSALKRDFGFEDAAGAQQPGASVFRLGSDGRPRHFYSVSAMLTPTQFRGMDLLTPFWSFLDLTPEGRGEFFPKRSYGG